ncbi:hypothetical protein ACFYUV_34350 [Nonomuraea sp. NPDC003560]|uniref:hypothetical protein n=1 Tax=Nonomuraea sp. NPDC003560 TaxID=3364341 RepID=UPI0036807D5E
MSVPATMRALQQTSLNGPQDMRLIVDAPVPSPGRGEVLVRVTAAGVNFADISKAHGVFAGGPGLQAPDPHHRPQYRRAEPGGTAGSRRDVIATTANGRPSAVVYHRDADGALRADGVVVLTPTATGIARVIKFHDPALVTTFGFPDALMH